MIGALWAILSMDVTERLVTAGIRAPGAFALTVIAATASTPIVLTTSAPHKLTTPIHAVVAGIVGIDGANGNWEVVPVDATHVYLRTYSPSGRVVPSVGSGVYVSGGTVTSALDSGRIRIGRKWRTVNGATNRITVSPYGSGTFGLIPYGGDVNPLVSLPSTLTQQPDEDHQRRQQPQILTDAHRFEVYFLGAMNPPDPDFGDYDIAIALRDQLFESMFRLMAGTWRVIGGRWESQIDDAKQWDSRGQEYSAMIEIQQPVLMEPLSFVPFGTSAELSINLEGGPSSDAIIVEVP